MLNCAVYFSSSDLPRQRELYSRSSVLADGSTWRPKQPVTAIHDVSCEYICKGNGDVIICRLKLKENVDFLKESHFNLVYKYCN